MKTEYYKAKKKIQIKGKYEGLYHKKLMSDIIEIKKGEKVLIAKSDNNVWLIYKDWYCFDETILDDFEFVEVFTEDNIWNQ